VSYLDPTRPAEERIQQAITHGPDIDAPGRYGPATRFVRRLIGRAVKYERDYGVQIDVALLDKVHESEEAGAQQLRETARQLREADQHLRDFAEQLLDNDHRANRDLTLALSRIESLESAMNEARSRLQDVDTRAAVATTMAAGAADALDMLTREREQTGRAVDAIRQQVAGLRTDADKGRFVYDELTSRPYIDEDHPLVTTDGRGRALLGYRGVAGPSPLYIGFEDIFRGSKELIRDRQRVYIDLIGDRGPVVDLGCGRGEMLELLVEAGIEARGVDLDEAMVDQARASGADVDHGDAVAFLTKQADASLGAIFSAQFIEHLPASLLPELLEIARTKLLPDGVFIAETVNPHSPRALKAFWIDPTHQHPLFPETMLALCRLTGFEEGQIMFPLGSGELENDLTSCGEYAVVAGARELF
jgi:SAM-dependent methyltransferase